MHRILIADDNDDMCGILSKSLTKRGFSVETACDGADAVEQVGSEEFDVVLADLRMPVLDGMQLLKKVKEISPSTIVIMITAYGTVEDAVEAMKFGAFDYVLKPFSSDEIEVKIRKALDHKLHEEERRLLRKVEFERMGGLVSKSRSMQEILAQIEAYASSSRLVLICGKSGTGKELVAREIHARSARADKPFMAINCVALDPVVQELDLFGCEKGVRDEMAGGKRGKLETADGGTVFIDEISELAEGAQKKLVEFLETGRFHCMGCKTARAADVRIIASCSERPEDILKKKSFDHTLCGKLMECSIDLPDLRERQDDIEDLAEYFIDKYSAQFHKHVKLSPEALGLLKDYSWPGNVHELENVMARAVITCRNDTILPSHLPANIAGPMAGVDSKAYHKEGVASQMDAIEKEVIRDALEKEDWNQSHAANRLGIKRTTLQYKLKKYGIRRQ